MSLVARDGVLVDDEPLVEGQPTAAELTEELLASLWSPRVPTWLLVLTGLGGTVFLGAAAWTVLTGVGLWGNDIPAAWAFAIVDFVWWIGIGHAGTFISAFLLLLEQPWRGSINRIAEAMTLFALVLAGISPLLHMGRPWYFYWLVPYPSTMGLWPQYRSALGWDVAAIATYSWVSLLFWYLGLVPDLAAARDRAPERWRARVYGVFALGWRGSARHWRIHRVAYGLMAGLAAPLVVSVHSIVSMDFATALLPGWHSTVFPVYFVVGAIHSGWGMVLVLLVPLRRRLGLERVITRRHLDLTARMVLVTACLMGWFYLLEFAGAAVSGERAEIGTVLEDRLLGHYAWATWSTMASVVLVPQVFWWRAARRSGPVLVGVGLFVLAGMWMERFFLVVGSLSHGELPATWGTYVPSVWDGVLLSSSCSLFLFLFLLFARFVPAVPLYEVKRLAAEKLG